MSKPPGTRLDRSPRRDGAQPAADGQQQQCGQCTAEHLHDQLSAADIVLAPDVLDRIDRIVAPGTDLNADDAGYRAAVLADTAHRRRSAAQ